jgi:hypothetical protein
MSANSGGSERATATMMKLEWRLGFMFGRNWRGEISGRCTHAYIGVWEESGRINI